MIQGEGLCVLNMHSTVNTRITTSVEVGPGRESNIISIGNVFPAIFKGTELLNFKFLNKLSAYSNHAHVRPVLGCSSIASN